MRTGFWVKRFFQVYAAAFAVIGAGRWLRTGDHESALLEAAIWALFAAVVFTVNGIWRTRRGDNQCPLCRDTPEPN